MNGIKSFFTSTLGSDSELSVFGKIVSFPFILLFGALWVWLYLFLSVMGVKDNDENI